MTLDPRHCYEILELREGATAEEAKRAYRQLIKTWHPDRYASDPVMRRISEEKMKTITEAYRMVESLVRLHGSVKRPSAVWPDAQQPPAGRVGPLEPIQVNDKWGYADGFGRVQIAASYDSAAEFFEGLAVVCRDDAFGYVNEQGEEVIALRFSFADRFAEGRALVEFGRYGYVSRSGDWVVKPRFQAGTRFQEGLAAVKLDGKWGYVQVTGSWFVLPRFDEAQTFQNGRAYARLDGRPVIVSRNGQVSEY